MTDAKPKPFFDLRDVAAIGAAVQGAPVQPKTVQQHLFESEEEVGGKRGGQVRRGKYADDPFPAPDDRHGNSPWWAKKRKREIEKWFERHPRRRVGDGIGGRPKKAQPNG
jgi:hypothetical protein